MTRRFAEETESSLRSLAVEPARALHFQVDLRHPNEALLRKAFEASLGGDVAPLRSIFDPKVNRRVSGHGPLSGELNGFDAILAWGAQLFQRSGGTWKEELLEVVANADAAFMRATYLATRQGRSVEGQSVNAFRIRAGQIVECRVFFGRQHGSDDFGS